MKNSSFILFAAAMFTGLFAHAQSAQTLNLKVHGLTVSPYQAFTDKKEIRLGYEHQYNRTYALELAFGFRYMGSDDPGLAPYNHEQQVATNYLKVQDGLTWFLFIPLPTNGRDDDWEEKEEQKRFYTNSNVYVSAGYKFYLTSSQHPKVAGGLYLAPSFTVGKKNLSEYVYSQGKRGDMTELESDYEMEGFPILLGFTGEEKLMREDIYEFDRLEIKRYDKSYVLPKLKIGYQLPIGQIFSADLGVSVGTKELKRPASARIEPSLKIGAWF